MSKQNWKRLPLVALAMLLSWNAVPALAQTVEYIHTDALGTPIAVTDASGNVIERNEYEPFGRQLAGGPADDPGFTGHVEDLSTGLTYMQQRYFDPALGVFISSDPVQASGSGSNFNRYWYANNNPFRFTDPDGRAPKGPKDMDLCTPECTIFDGGGGSSDGGRTASSGTISRTQMMARQTASANANDYDRTDPLFHEYSIESRLCNVGPGCSITELASLVNADSAPRWGSVVDGPNTLWLNNPIVHSTRYDKDGSFYMVNVTDSRHDFHAGAVVSRLVQSGGAIYLQTHGFGYSSGSTAKAMNYAAGYGYFVLWQAQVVSAAKIQTGQIDPGALK